MGITQDTTELKKLFEAEPIFKAASPENLDKRKDILTKEEAIRKSEILKRAKANKVKGPPYISTDRGHCPLCGSDNLDYHDHDSGDDWYQYEFRCGDCGADGVENYNMQYTESVIDQDPEGDPDVHYIQI